MRILKCLLLLIVVSTTICNAQRRTAFFGSSGVQVVEIEGQSNIGSADDVPGDLSFTTNNYIFFSTVTSNGWQPMVARTNSSFVGKFGPEVRLGKLLRDYYRRPIYFFKHGTGGVTLAQVAGTDWNASSTGKIFDDHITAYALAMGTIATSKKKSDWAIWIQGEQDTSQDGYANAYAANIINWINAKRTRQNNPGLKFILTSLSTTQNLDATRRNTVNAAMQACAQYVYDTTAGNTVTTQSGGSVINGVWYVKQNGTCQADNLHYNGAAFDVMAYAYFDIMVNYN